MQTMLDPIKRALSVAADHEALVCDDRRLTYREFSDRLQRLHSVLLDCGLRQGDRVAILAHNSIAFAESYCAIPMAGLVQAPLNFRWAEPELAYGLEDAGARVLITDRDPGELSELVERVIRIDDGEYEALLTAATPTPFDDDAVHEDDLAGLFYTGGTTGASKGVMLTHRNLIANAWNSQFAIPMDRSDRYLVMAPMFHAAGSVAVLQSIFVGATLVIMPAFDAATMLDLVEAEQITQTLGVPAMVAATMEEQLARPRDVSTLRTYAHGASPIALEVVRRATQAFPTTRFNHVYGATETAPLVTGLPDELDWLDHERAKSAGQAVMGCQVVTRRPDGTATEVGEPGEVTVRGANVMAGYWNKPEQTAAALRDGWYWSGDIGRLDEEGYLFLLDRSKDMIISGGENVYCTEVEDALYTHPGVLEATVFGIPHERWGEAVHAVVVLREDAGDVDASTLIEHCRGRIAGYKLPQSIEFRADGLPKSGPGKVLKRELRQPYWAGREGTIG